MKKTLLIFIPFLSLLGQSISTDQLDQLTFRNIGPSVAGGRIHDIEVLPNDPATVFIASASGAYGSLPIKGQPGNLCSMTNRFQRLAIWPFHYPTQM